jgi:hypothetical protein
VRILLWHVHGSWTTSFVQGRHEYLLPVDPGRTADGRGRAETWTWPASAREVPVEELADTAFDVVVLQRPHEAALVHRWTGRRVGADLPAVYVEHNTPAGDVPYTRHPFADQSQIPVVHVTHFNRLMWDNGCAPTTVVEHGIIDPGLRYTGELAHAAASVNDPVRRGRAVGADVLLGLARDVPVDVFGIGAEGLARTAHSGAGALRAVESLTQDDLHRELARRRVYVHTCRWTSLGLSLLEAMHLGMPVVALATTEACRAVPPGAGMLAEDEEALVRETVRLVRDPQSARACGQQAREAALGRYGLKRFLDDWDRVLERRLP